MSTYDRQHGKTPCSDSEAAASSSTDKPAEIRYETPLGTSTIDAQHHIRGDAWVSIYEERDGSGIDVHVPRERVITINRTNGGGGQ